jgi:uncharacterized membrane protein
MGTVILTFVVILIYFIPSISAYSNKKKSAGSVLVLNALLGWTLIGWVVALVWATKKDMVDLVGKEHKNTTSATEQLEKLAELKRKGVITETEFEKQKQKILA